MKKSEQTKDTIRKLTKVARDYFTEQGYAHASMEVIVNKAGLTRGALYHHFGSKEGLFHAVLESVQQEIAEKVEAEAAKSDDLWEQLLLGCRAFVSAAVEPQNRRILLIDGPAVLGWETWRTMDQQNSMRLLKDQLEVMAQHGCLRPISINTLVHLLSGAMNEAALWIAPKPNQKQSLEEISEVLSLFMEGFRSR
ncbi:TetR/AcrR family transcriptional regulator [Metabacillus arenae]|uniref:TetR/AcrR family transcriptional regulator n=1 Tax=Metabacillus arenae TaxID=2771434 RepID=A0A926NL36_9BACI|nr:TetR/AcrR family transcriptional regulator [Metabacillus arenae]MBD1383035.1 TetR/AcrR family transcriptional regulator [Metabacillus arenae]